MGSDEYERAVVNADRIVASFLGLMAETLRECDQCGCRVPRSQLILYVEGNVCERCVSKASY